MMTTALEGTGGESSSCGWMLEVSPGGKEKKKDYLRSAEAKRCRGGGLELSGPTRRQRRSVVQVLERGYILAGPSYGAWFLGWIEGGREEAAATVTSRLGYRGPRH